MGIIDSPQKCKVHFNYRIIMISSFSLFCIKRNVDKLVSLYMLVFAP